ncbi:MAG: ATP-binding cassette subfamily B protein [Paraglaciecola sp.]|jgi:ATP-binding cassette subfamily B protein
MKLYSTLTNTAFKKLIPVSLGWCAVALLESFSYIAIAFAILKQWPLELTIAIGLLTILLTVVVTRAGFHVGATLTSAIYDVVYQMLKRIKVTWFTTANRAQLLSLTTQQIPRFMSIPAHQLQHFIHAPLLALIITIAMFWISGYQVALLLGFLLTLSLFIQYHAQRALAKTDQVRSQTEVAVTTSVLELVDDIELLRCASGCQQATQRVELAWTTQDNAIAQTNKAAALATFYSAIAGTLPTVGVLLFLFSSRPQGELYLAVILLTLRASYPIERLALAALGINDQRKAVKNYCQLLNAPTLYEPIHPLAVLPNQQTLTLEKVTYRPILSHFSCTIKPSTRVLISGASGSGKSTLLHMLMRFDDPQSGDVRLGNVLLSTIPLEQRATYFAYVPQSPAIFDGTIESNIRLSRTDATDEEIEQVARKMMLGKLLDRSPLGIYQTIGEQGKRLSGGERQRIALAQALLKNAPILVLDEATSALDLQTESNIAKEIKKLKCTILIVTHRNPEIWQAEQIICLP